MDRESLHMFRKRNFFIFQEYTCREKKLAQNLIITSKTAALYILYIFLGGGGVAAFNSS